MDRVQVALMSDREVALWWGNEDEDPDPETIADNLYTHLLILARGWRAVGVSPEEGTATLTEEEWQRASDGLVYGLEGWDYGLSPIGGAGEEARKFIQEWDEEDNNYTDGDITTLSPQALRWLDTGQVVPSTSLRQ